MTAAGLADYYFLMDRLRFIAVWCAVVFSVSVGTRLFFMEAPADRLTRIFLCFLAGRSPRRPWAWRVVADAVLAPFTRAASGHCRY